MHGVFESITVSRQDGKSAVSISPEGVWVTGDDSRVSASIQFDNNVPVLAVMDHRKSDQTGHQIALSVDKDGAPVVQISMGDKTVVISGDELFKKLG